MLGTEHLRFESGRVASEWIGPPVRPSTVWSSSQECVWRRGEVPNIKAGQRPAAPELQPPRLAAQENALPELPGRLTAGHGALARRGKLGAVLVSADSSLRIDGSAKADARLARGRVQRNAALTRDKAYAEETCRRVKRSMRARKPLRMSSTQRAARARIAPPSGPRLTSRAPML